MGTQDQWRWCNKCQGLAFSAGASLGQCSGGGFHEHQGSGNYVLVVNDKSAPGQAGWQWCQKCQALAFTGAGILGACPAGGQHNHAGSGNYTLVQNPPAGQSAWMYCSKCQMITFGGAGQLGPCPAGGTHDHSQSGNYALVEDQNSAVASWQLGSMSAGKVDFNGGSLIIRQNGAWQFYGSLHDNSFWYGDNWALGFVIGNTGHGAVAQGNLGATVSGGPVDGNFNLTGTDPWITNNWQNAVSSSIHCHLHVTGDPASLVGPVISDLEKYGPTFVSLLASL
jgi:hypothetical protein